MMLISVFSIKERVMHNLTNIGHSVHLVMNNFAALLRICFLLCCVCSVPVAVRSASIPRSISPDPARKVRQAAGNENIVEIEWSRAGVQRYNVR